MFVLQWSLAPLVCVLLWSIFSLFPPFPTLCLSLFRHPFFCPSFPSKVMHLMKGEFCPRIMMTITSCTPHLLHCLLPWLPCTYSTLLFSCPPPPPSFILSVCHSFSRLLIPNSTFHQLLVSPNSCHGDVDRLGTFRLAPCKCGSLKWRVG